MSLSVIISTYNHAHFLPECLNSVFDQQRPADEVIIINDASTDNTIEVIESFRRLHPQLILLNNTKNQGPAANLNRALSLATGKYIAGCAADDLVLSNFFQSAVTCLEQNPSFLFCCGDTYQFIDRKPYQFRFLKTLKRKAPAFFNAEDALKLFHSENFVIQSHACLYRRDAILENGGFIPELGSLCDWYLNVSLALKQGFIYLPETFAAYRLCEGSYANKWAKNPSLRKKVLDHLFKLLEDSPEKMKQFGKGALFSQFYYQYFWDFLKRPRYWGLTFSSFFIKAKKIWKNKILALLQKS